VYYALAIVLSYLLGSITFSFVIGKLKGIDIRKHGSGNAGATNALRVLGFFPAISVLILDIGKGAITVWIAQSVFVEAWVVVGCAFMVIAGHNWPIFFGFRGGKGIATTIGVAAVLCFYPTLFAVVVAVIVIAITRYVSLGSLIFATVLPFFIWFFDFPSAFLGFSIAIAIIAYIRHKNNIIKLFKGQENKIGSTRGEMQ